MNNPTCGFPPIYKCKEQTNNPKIREFSVLSKKISLIDILKNRKKNIYETE